MVDFLVAKACGAGEGSDRLVLRVIVDFIAKAADLYLSRSQGRFKRCDLPLTFGAVCQEAAHADAGGVAEDQRLHLPSACWRTEEREQAGRPVFFHDDGREEYIQSPGLLQFFHDKAEGFAGGVVNVGVDLQDGVCL